MRRLLLVVVLLLAVTCLQAPSATAAPPPDRTRWGLTTITPARVLDTRTETGGHEGLVQAGETVDFRVSPSLNRRAVVLNLTVVGATRDGFASAHPSTAGTDTSSTPRAPTTSTVNYTAGRAVANQAIVEVPLSGLVSVYTSAAAHLVVDVTGYYDQTSEFGPYRTQSPKRVLDTRTGLGAPKRRVAAGGVVQMSLTDADGASPAGQRAAVLNVTAIDSTGAGYVSVYNRYDKRPTASTLNITRGPTVAAMTIVKYNFGDIDLYSSASTHLVVDVIGWVPSSESDYQPLKPARTLDTRSGLGAPTGTVSGGAEVDLTVAGRGGVPGLSATHPPVAVEVNVTAVSPTGSGHVTAYDAGSDRPQVSMLNYAAGETRSNTATVRLSADGKVRLYTSSRTHLLVDVVGYFVAVTPRPSISTAPLPGATVGQPYRAGLSVSGGVGPYTWSADRLPAGLALDAATGVVSGTPTTVGETSLDVRVRDAEEGYSDSVSIDLYVHPTRGDSAKQVAAGWHHTCAVLSSGSVQCWGDNHLGATGSSTVGQSATPVTVAGLDGRATAVATGLQHSCALLEAGEVWCWGSNSSGPMGNGSSTTSSPPVEVTGLAGPAVAVAAGSAHTCALLVDRTVTCWGGNGNGQLGDGSLTSSTTPVPVVGLTDVVSISAGGAHTCAATSSGAASCWGNNTYGQLGDGTQTRRTAPVTVSGLGTGVASIEGGHSHTCAVLTSGGVDCWGYNYDWEVTPGSARSLFVLTPTAIPGLDGSAVTVSAGHYSNCALLASGGTQCWGGNADGVLGNGTAVGTGRLPATVAGLTHTTSVSVGDAHACAVGAGGQTRCWGSNDYGQVGDSFTTNRLSPETVVGLEGSGS